MAAEITEIYVHPGHRGSGRGAAMPRVAIEAEGGVRNLWIAADDEDRPKQLYARLGFRRHGGRWRPWGCLGVDP